MEGKNAGHGGNGGALSFKQSCGETFTGKVTGRMSKRRSYK